MGVTVMLNIEIFRQFLKLLYCFAGGGCLRLAMDGSVPGFPYSKGIIPQSYDYFGSAAKSFCRPLFIFTRYGGLNCPSPLVTDSPPENIFPSYLSLFAEGFANCIL
jgi:hypothetical protein